MLGFQSVSRFFASICIGQICHLSSIRVESIYYALTFDSKKDVNYDHIFLMNTLADNTHTLDVPMLRQI